MSAGLFGTSAIKLALATKRARAEINANLGVSEPIAVVGIGCRFPGGANSPDEYWQMLLREVDAIREIPPDRWIAADWYNTDVRTPGKMNTRWGSFVDKVEQFDPAFFGIAPREAVAMDPQQRLILEVTWEALWNAGIAPEALAGSATGVFTSIYNADYGRLSLADPANIGPHSCAGISNAIASGRVSYLLDLRGPSISVDAACSSSLVAVHLACQSLRAGDSRVALAGGVALHLTPEHWVSLSKLGMLSPDGRCRTFDARANGFVPGEGCGVVVLKRLVDAIADGDRMHAVIRGTAVLQDGRSTVMTAPNGLAQQEVVRAALENGFVGPEQITYVETHGTGTPLGDPIEVEALAEVLKDAPSCFLGSVKSNIGHLEAAAGIAGLIKAVLALENEQIPANLHFETPNPHLSLDATPFVIPTEAVAWPRNSVGRFAGVSAFGFGGTNAHVVLEEAPRLPAVRIEQRTGPFLLPISARNPDALTALADSYRNLLETTTSAEEVCRASALRRSHYEERIAVVGSTAAELRDALRDVAAGRTRLGASRGSATEDTGVVFVCSGQGSQWARMGAGLLRDEPVFRTAIEECDAAILKHAGWSLTTELEAIEPASRLEHTEYAQPAIVAIEIALARLWESWGIVPSAVIGHSVGEIAAAHIAGAIDLDEAMRIVVLRGRLMERATGSGRMAAIFTAAAEVQSDIARFGSALSLAAVNSPQSVVISGERAAVEAMLAKCRERGIGCRELPVDYAFHSEQMQPFSEELTRTLGAVSTRKPMIPMISTVKGQLAQNAELDAAYWGRNIREPVRFADGIASAMTQGGGTFVEIGPHPVLSVSVQECIAAAAGNASVFPSLRRNQDERSTLLTSLGGLYTRGATVEWASVYPGRVAVIDLPAYPYQRQRYWVQSSASSPSAVQPTLRPMLGRRIQSPLLAGVGYETEISIETHPYLADHRIGDSTILPMTGFLEVVLEAIAIGSDVRGAVLDDFVVQQSLVFHEGERRTIQVLLEGPSFRLFSLDSDRWILHASGQFHSDSGNTAAPTPSVVGSPRDISEHYLRAAERGAHFGPSFQTIAELSASDDTTTATVRLTAEAAAISGYAIHPTLLDGCFQTVLAAAGADDGPSWIPIAIDRFELFSEAPSELRSVLKLRPRDESSETLVADLWITACDGAPVATVTGLRLRRMQSTAADTVSRFTYVPRWQVRQRGAVRAATAAGARWLLLGGESGIGAQLCAELTRRGQVCIVAPLDAATESLDVANLRGVLHICASESVRESVVSESRDALRSALQLSQQLARQSGAAPALWFVTRNALAATTHDNVEGFAQGAVLGLARTIAVELPDLACATVDIDYACNVSFLADEILLSDGEDRVALRGTDRYALRLEHAEVDTALAERRLAIPQRGSIDGLKLERLDRRAPGADEVEVLVEAASLNFRDVMNVLGMYPGEAGALGVEFAGRIARVGDGVSSWEVGDRVMGIAWGSFATHVVTPAALITSIPSGMDVEAAATVPNAFLTAHYCLIRTARLAKGDRVLIHSGAGGVGMAAIQLALDTGAEVFATAGNEDKRAYLRTLGVHHVLDSRSLEFSARILELTDGRGVDVVLNALSGEFIAASFAAIAERGRFVEIGKIGLWTKDQVAALGKHVEYHVIDLADVINGRPASIGEELRVIRDLMSAGRIHPLPYRTFPLEEAQAAFRYMAQARHIGRIVLRVAPDPIVRPDATYLITGGLGAIGLHVARWLAESGARYLVLLGRSAPSAEAEAALCEIRESGTTVVTVAADVANRDQLADVLRTVAGTMPRLCGVIHAAGVVDDGVLVQQTWERFAGVLAPKLDGAWNLHELTSESALDFFVMFSSVASLLGSPSQGAYAAGNAFLDALASRRRALGSHALSVNWGAWAGSGMAARVEQKGRMRVLSAVHPMTPEACLDALGHALHQDNTQIAIADVTWGEWTTEVPSLVSELAGGGGARADTFKSPLHDNSGIADIAQQLRIAPEASRRGLLIAFIRQEARRVLGLGENHPIDERQPLLRLGLDSLMAVELRNRMALALGRPLPATLLFDYPSPSVLTDFVLGIDSRRAAAPNGDSLLSDIASMSDEDAERELERELDGKGSFRG